MGGTVAIIGGELEPFKLISGAKRLSGIYVGSRAMAEDLCRFVQATRIKPVIDRVFRFDEAPQAYEHLAAERHFGKVVVQVGD